MKRVYPLTKKAVTGGFTLYDQEASVISANKSPKPTRNIRKSVKTEDDHDKEVNDAYGTDGGYTSGEEVLSVADKAAITDKQTQSIFKKTETSQMNRSILNKVGVSQDSMTV